MAPPANVEEMPSAKRPICRRIRSFPLIDDLASASASERNQRNGAKKLISHTHSLNKEKKNTLDMQILVPYTSGVERRRQRQSRSPVSRPMAQSNCCPTSLEYCCGYCATAVDGPFRQGLLAV